MVRKKIAVIVGSLRKGSFNRKMARALISLAPDSLACELVEIRGLPLYDQDLDDNRLLNGPSSGSGSGNTMASCLLRPSTTGRFRAP
jgi:hypothetical protein